MLLERSREVSLRSAYFDDDPGRMDTRGRDRVMCDGGWLKELAAALSLNFFRL
jgi:hypothetical protein